MLSVIFFPVLAILLLTIKLITSRKTLPPGTKALPGPRGLPWLGPFHKLRQNYSWLIWDKWAKEHGPIYATTIMGNPHVVISKESIAHDLLDKKGAIYSDRPPVGSIKNSKSSGSFGDGIGEYLPFMGKNDYWRRQRKFGHSTLTTLHRTSFLSLPSIEAKLMLHSMLHSPAAYSTNIEDFTSRVMARLGWGDVSIAADLKASARRLMWQVSASGPLTNILPPLTWIPDILSPWARAEKKRHDKTRAWYIERMRDVQRRMETKTAPESFMRSYFESKGSYKWDSDAEGAGAVGMIATAGIFTVGSPLHTFLLAMVLHPLWLKKVQDEIDAVCGGERAPEMADYARLPLLRAVVKEVLRWRPAAPLGVGHQLEQDDVFNSYHIPKGSYVHALEWSFSRDPEVYPEPDLFNPQRWLDPASPVYKEPLTQYPSIQGHHSFGFGRRTCLGQNLTDAMLFVGCGGIAWGFDLSKKVDPVTGEEIYVPDNDYNSLLLVRPEPFEFEMKPRTEKHAKAIEQQYREVQEKLL